MRDIVWVNDVISLSNSRLVQVSLNETNRNDANETGAHLHRVSVYSNSSLMKKSTIWNFYGTFGLRDVLCSFSWWCRALILFFAYARAYEQKQLNRNKFMRLSHSRLNLLKWNFTAASSSNSSQSATIEPEILESTSAAGLMSVLCGARRSTSSTLGEARNIFILYGLIKKMIDKIFKRKWNEKLLQVFQEILSIFIPLSCAHRRTRTTRWRSLLLLFILQWWVDEISSEICSVSTRYGCGGNHHV